MSKCKVKIFAFLFVTLFIVAIFYYNFSYSGALITISLNVFLFTILLLVAFLILLILNRNLVDALFPLVNSNNNSDNLCKTLGSLVNKLEYRDNVLLEEKKLAENQSKEKSDFMIKMSHEMRTPMHAIINFAEIGKEKVGDNEPEKVKSYFQKIEDNSERLLNLINSLLDLTSLESGKINFNFEENNIIDCINSVCAEMKSILDKKSVNIIIEQKDDIKNIKFDSDNIKSVLVNIIANAVKFSPENSSITIYAGYGNFQIGSYDKKTTGLKISVSDKGPGIEELEKELIFDKFIKGSRKAPGIAGNGIGLAICREIISRHNGSIWAENNEDGGAVIHFVIPE